MKKSLRPLLVLLVVAVAFFAVARLWQGWQRDKTANALEGVIRSADLNELLDASSEEFAENVDQAMRGLKLAQGERGREIWGLEAVWGTLREGSGVVDLQGPKIRYAIGEPDDDGNVDYVRARADRGRVEDNNTLMTMRDGVFAEWQDQTLSGPVAVFRNDTRVLTLPQGGVFTDKNLKGRGDVLRWDLKANIMEAEGGVRFVWTPGGTASAAPPGTFVTTPEGAESQASPSSEATSGSDAPDNAPSADSSIPPSGEDGENNF